MTRLLARSFVASLALAAACNGELQTAPAPGSEAGLYVLVSVNGHAPPATIDSSADDLGVLEADTLTLDGNGAALRGRTIRRVITQFGTQIYHVHYAQEYRITGSAIEVGVFHCPPGALCVQNEHGTIDGDHLTLAYPGFRTERFVRVGSP